jgi:predicted AlkP superfamily phosphohydrolase/phosphomutase
LSKLVILGIDALDPGLVEKWADDLPNMSKIMKAGGYRRLESTKPPDSIPAWVTIFTGQHPWQHGIVDTMDYLDFKGKSELDTSALIGKTFWDRASDAGKRVCIVNPLLAYPVWKLNGIMVNGPVFITGEVQAEPPDILARFEIPELGGMTDFPKKSELPAFIERTEFVTRDLARFGLELMDLEEWDLFFLSFLTLDRVMHYLWRYMDPEDPTYPGRNEFEGAIKKFFVLFDEVIGDFTERLSSDQVLLVVSDHGHGMRPPNAVFVNEVLRGEGYLACRQGGAGRLSPVAMVERAKNIFLTVMQKLDLEDWVYRIAHMIPKEKRKSLKSSSYATVKDESLAWVSDLGGGTSYSGIEMNRELIEASGEDYEALRDRLISLLLSLRDKEGEQVVLYARRREEAYAGESVDKYPDIVFELKDTYGVDRTLYCGTLGMTTTHKKVSGGHAQFGVFMLHNSKLPLPEGDVHISEVFPTVLGVLGLGG